MGFDFSLVDFFPVVLILPFCVAAYIVSGRKGLALYSIFIPLTAAFIGELGLGYILLALIGTVGAMFSLKKNEENFWLVFVLSLVLIGVLLFIAVWYSKVPDYEVAFAAGGLGRFLKSAIVVSFNSLLITVSALMGGKMLYFFKDWELWDDLKDRWKVVLKYALFLFAGVVVVVVIDLYVGIGKGAEVVALFLLYAVIGFIAMLVYSGAIQLLVVLLAFAFCLVPSVPFLYLAGTNLPADLSLLLIAVFLILIAFVFKGCTCLYENEAKRDEEENCALAVARVSALLLRYNGGYTEKAQELFRKFIEENYSEKDKLIKKVEKHLLSLIEIKNLSYKKCCKEVRDNVPQAERAKVARLLFDIAVIDGVIYPEERNLLHQVMVHLLISEEQVQLLTDMYSRYFYESRASSERAQGTYTSSGSYVPSRLVEAYAKLGLKPGTCLDEVKRVYRRLVFENHPDRLVGADEATRAAANERIREVNRAMSVIAEYAS